MNTVLPTTLAGAAFALLVATVAACGTRNPADPLLIPGGGVGSGEIARFLNVYVIDDASGDPIEGAYVAAVGADTSLSGYTDATGLIIFHDRHLAGPQDVTAAAAGFANTTWIGVNGANATVPLRIDDGGPPNVEMADVRGTIPSFDALPAPAPDHYWLAIIGYTWVDRFGDPANDIVQPDVLGVPENICVNTGSGFDPACAWRMFARTGPQAHYYFLLDVDSQGTIDPADDVGVTVGWGFLGGLDLTNGAVVMNEVLPAPMMDVATVDITLPAAPSGLDQTLAAVTVDLRSEEGWLPVAGVGNRTGAWAPVVPALTGPLNGGVYRVVAGAAESVPSATIPSAWLNYTFDAAAGGIDLPDFLTPPAGLSVSGATFTFLADADATAGAVELRDDLGPLIWQVGIADLVADASFTLPVLPDEANGMPFPSGPSAWFVATVDIEGWVSNDFSEDSLRGGEGRGAAAAQSF